MSVFGLVSISTTPCVGRSEMNIVFRFFWMRTLVFSGRSSEIALIRNFYLTDASVCVWPWMAFMSMKTKKVSERNWAQNLQFTKQTLPAVVRCHASDRSVLLSMSPVWPCSGLRWQFSPPSRSLQSKAHVIFRFAHCVWIFWWWIWLQVLASGTTTSIQEEGCIHGRADRGELWCRDTHLHSCFFLILFSIPLHSTNPNLLRIFLGAQTVLDGVRREDAGQEILFGVARRRSIFEGKCRLCRESSNTFQTSGSHKENSECDGTQERQEECAEAQNLVNSTLNEHRKVNEENIALKQKLSEANRKTEEFEKILRCSVCLVARVSVVFMPCQHVCCCKPCWKTWSERYGSCAPCPMCRKDTLWAIDLLLWEP